MAASVTPFLMFQHGRAEEALRLYTSLFPELEVLRLERFGADAGAAEGWLRECEVSFRGQRVRLFDSPAPHAFDFTPSFSFFVETSDPDEFERLFAALSQDGAVMMPPDDYGFSRRFAWTADRFGVSWQIALSG